MGQPHLWWSDKELSVAPAPGLASETWDGDYVNQPAWRCIFSGVTRGLIRFQQCGDFHFLTFSCFHRLPHLGTPAARNLFEAALERIRIRYGLTVAGYVVMPEHVHLLVSGPREGTLAQAVQALKLSVARRRTERPFWQTRYYDFNVHSIEKVSEKIGYAHRNPVARGLVSSPEDWPWSSYRHYITGERGTVEIESMWTAARRGYELPEGFEMRKTTG
jgi:putative transposase